MLALVEAYRSGLLQPHYWLKNIGAGLVVGIVALPLAMAFAIASGAQPEQGIITAIIGALAVAVFGGSPVQIAGPTGAFIVILASITAQYGILGLQMATFLAGLLLIAMGFLKLGHIMKYIPEPVIVGFTTGIGVLIFVTQWKDLFGLPLKLALDAPFYLKLSLLIAALPHFNASTTAIAILSLLLTLYSARFIPRIPSPLIAMVTATGIVAHFHLTSIATIGSVFGQIPNQWPSLHWLPLSLPAITSLLLPAVSIALLGAIESLLSATAADKMAKTKHHANQELIGQGLANLLTPLFGGFAATGAIARTATNVKQGGNSPLAAIVHSVFLLAVLLYLAPLANHVPLCALAAILTVVAYHMSDLKHFTRLTTQETRSTAIVLWVTFLLTVFTNLIIAVMAGVVLAYFLGLQLDTAAEAQP